MSIKEATYYTAVCDFPGCGREDNEGEYSAWAERSMAIESATDADWQQDEDGRRHYCWDHPVVWDVDIEDGYEPPAPPYLVMLDASGMVRLVTEGAAR